MWQWPYSAFGNNKTTSVLNVTVKAKTKPEPQKILVEGTKAAQENNLRMAGQYFDEETATHQNGFREYEPLTGTYRQMDPIGFGGGLNKRGYANGNPLAMIDPRGLSGSMPGGGLWSPTVVDNGSSCSPLIPPPRVDDNGCILTGGGPALCLGPAAIRSVATTLPEELALQAAKSGTGSRIMQGLINDPKYPEDVWAKMQSVHFDAAQGKKYCHSLLGKLNQRASRGV